MNRRKPNRYHWGRIVTTIMVTCDWCGDTMEWDKWLGDGRRGRLSASKVAVWIRDKGWKLRQGRWLCPKEKP